MGYAGRPFRSPTPKDDAMRALLITTTSVLLLAGAAAQGAEPKTEDEKAMYALGIALSQQIQPFSLSEAELAMVQAGLADGALGKPPKADPQTYLPRLQELAQTRLAAAASKNEQAGKAYADKAAAQKGAKKTASGLVYVPLKEGTGPSPVATDQVKVHYHGTFVDGKVFDSSVQRNEPAEFTLNHVIKCWTEGVQMMKVGGKSRLVCPADIAYGAQGRPPEIPPGSTLVFEVELLGIAKPEPQPPAQTK
jgi:FKBP-type peptidyl-prolyl cis-trans isomerase FkpA